MDGLSACFEYLAWLSGPHTDLITFDECCTLMPLQQGALGSVGGAGEETESLGGMYGMIQCACVHEGDPCSNACTSLGTEHVLPQQRGHVQFSGLDTKRP